MLTDYNYEHIADTTHKERRTNNRGHSTYTRLIFFFATLPFSEALGLNASNDLQPSHLAQSPCIRRDCTALGWLRNRYQRYRVRCVGRLFGVIQGLFLNLLIRIVFVIFRNRVLSFPLPVFIVFVTF